MIMVCNLGNFTGDEIRNCPPYSEGKERLKKEAVHSILVDGSFNKQGKSSWAAIKQIDLYTHPPESEKFT